MRLWPSWNTHVGRYYFAVAKSVQSCELGRAKVFLCTTMKSREMLMTGALRPQVAGE
jgi:hypothetical protein